MPIQINGRDRDVMVASIDAWAAEVSGAFDQLPAGTQAAVVRLAGEMARLRNKLRSEGRENLTRIARINTNY